MRDIFTSPCVQSGTYVTALGATLEVLDCSKADETVNLFIYDQVVCAEDIDELIEQLVMIAEALREGNINEQ